MSCDSVFVEKSEVFEANIQDFRCQEMSRAATLAMRPNSLNILEMHHDDGGVSDTI